MVRVRTLAVALSLLAAGVVLALAPRRSEEFARAVAVLPTDVRQVLLARSPDGLAWRVEDHVEARPADTPDLVELDGRILLYYLHGSEDRLMVQELGGPAVALDLGEACAEAAGYACVDPAGLALPGGGLRLFFVQAAAGVDPALDPGARIRAARSADGVRFEVEADPVLAGTGRVDPDPVRLPDGRLRLYTTRVVDGGAPGGPGIVVESAVGPDAGPLVPEPGVRLHDASATRTVHGPDGAVTWFHDHDGGLRRATSPDGLRYGDERPRVLGPDLPGWRALGAEAPGVLRTAEGWLLAFSTAREPWWPINLRVAREAVREAAVAP